MPWSERVEAMLAKGKAIAATVLEAAEADIEYHGGRFDVVGTDRRISLFELAARAKEMKERGDIAEDLDTKALDRDAADVPERLSYRRGRDRPADRRDRPRRLFRGGRLRQRARPHDRRGPGARLGRAGRRPGDDGADGLRSDGGQLVTGSFMDYAMPRAQDLPPFKDDVHQVPATTNPLGVKGAGEAGTTAAIAAVMNAFADAIPGGAGAHLDMPATPEKIWRACREISQ